MVPLTIELPEIADLNHWIEKAETARQVLLGRNGAGNDFLGWLDLPEQLADSALLTQIEKEAERVQKMGKALVVVGIGGSYLGARAVIDALASPWHNLQVLNGAKKGCAIFYAGNHLDSADLENLLSMVESMDFSINVISKSGTTTEPGVAFRILKNIVKQKYGQNYNERIIATTDQSKGALRKMATMENYVSFVIADDVGGRYSVFTAVGLLPIAAAGLSIRDLIAGSAAMRKHLFQASSQENLAVQYAAFRNQQYNSGKSMEVMISYLSRTQMVAEWWKQLFGESEGKAGKALWPASVQFTTDLHSLGQWLQEGPRSFFETIVDWQESGQLSIPADPDNFDGLNYLQGKKISYINGIAQEATKMAHESGGVKVAKLKPGVLNAYNLGALLYFFEFSCAVSGYMLGVNPFVQPGVESYKKNMFQLLGKP